MVPKKHKLAGILAGVLICSFLFFSQVKAANYYYVATTGSDSNPGTLTQPFRTIQKGVDKLAAGDTLYIRGGTYTEKIKVIVSGSAGAPITITSYPGETAIMDGSGLPPESSEWNHIVEVSGSYLVIQNLEITYPKGWGILNSQTATHNFYRGLNVHTFYRSAFDIWGRYNTVENNKIWKTNLVNDLVKYPGAGDWSGALAIGNTNPGTGNYGTYTMVRNNLVYDNYGEGIICMYSDDSVIEGNIVWDNWAADIYLDQCSNYTIKRNLVYYTTDHEYWRNADFPAVGIELSNEGIINPFPIGHDRMIYNNIVVNTGAGINFWTGKVVGSALINDFILYNTIVNNFTYGLYGFGFDFGAPKGSGVFHQNTFIENNIITVLNLPANSVSMTGLTFSHNLWASPPEQKFKGPGDIVANPLLSNPAHSIDVSIDPAWYILTSSSPAIDKAVVISGILTDYFGTARGLSPDIGAYEIPTIKTGFASFLPMVQFGY